MRVHLTECGMVVRKILAHLGEPTEAPPMASACGPLLWKRADAEQCECDAQAQPTPDNEFDQRIA